MPRVPNRPPGALIFGRVDRCHFACPVCDTLIVAHGDTRAGRTYKGRRPRGQIFNPILSQVVCPGCRQRFGVGLLLWPARLIYRGQGSAVPADHRPSKRQIAELAQYTVGVWADEQRRLGDELNIYIEAECSCPMEEGSFKPSCPVHGWEAWRRRQDALGTGGTPPAVESEDDEGSK